jgi:hypothetical protein
MRLLRLRMFAAVAGLTALIAAPGCFYPPTTAPPPDAQQRVIIPLPYDLAWDAVNHMITENGMRVQATEPNYGIIEAVGPRFTLHDADCGKIKSIAGTYTAEPEQDSSTVYNFLVRPHGKEASSVEVRGTFHSAVKVPLRPTKDVDCVSRGIEESNLLREVLVEAKKTHRPVFANPPAQAAAPGPTTGLVTPPASNASPAPKPILSQKSTIEKSDPSDATPRFSLGGSLTNRLAPGSLGTPSP